MRKRVLGLVLACAMVMTAGCGAKGNKPADGKATDSKAAESTASDAGVKDEAAESASAEEITTESAADSEEQKENTEKEAYKLEYWAEGSPVVKSIESYVADVTDENSEHFIPLEDRIAVFDLDGTIIGELYPSYFEYMMFIHRALYDDTYEAPEDMKEFAQALEEGIATGNMPEGNELKHATYAGQSYAGMTIDELKAYTKEFMKSEADGFVNLTRGEAFYKPMVSMVKYLDANGFQCYIVSGSDRTVVRALIEDILPIPENRVIGMSYSMVATGEGDEDGLEYQYQEGDQVILGGDLVIKTIKMNKVSEIELEIGKVPVLSFGNSSGDLSMDQYVYNNDKYESKVYMVLCDDLEREHGNMEKADSIRAACEEHGYETISMRDDFATIYGDDVTIKAYSFEEAAAEEQAVESVAESAAESEAEEEVLDAAA